MNASVVHVTLESHEAEVIRRSLSQFLSDLRMEIAHTDNYAFRQDLKMDEAVIKNVVQKLTQEG